MNIMNILKSRFINFKKIFVILVSIFIGIFVGFTSDRVTNNKPSNFIMLTYLYFTNSSLIQFNGISIKAPYSYTRTQDKNNLTLVKFPLGREIIFISNKHLSKEKLNNEYKAALCKINYQLINEGEIIIDNEKGYFFTMSKMNNPSEYEEYLTIPTKSIVISFVGERADSQDFWEIVKKIRFINGNAS
jgi:hypothetical protein